MGEPSKPALRRVVGTLGGLLLTLATLSPSLGVFVIGNDMLHQAGSATVACLLVATILGLAVAAVYAELGSAFPHPGAEYTLAGRVLGPRAGFAMMATNLIGLPISMAVSGLGIADYLQGMMPGLSDRAVAIPAILAAWSPGCWWRARWPRWRSPSAWAWRTRNRMGCIGCCIQPWPWPAAALDLCRWVCWRWSVRRASTR
jgi:amino acid transporter